MKDKPSSEETKLCPYCMGEISVSAIKCSHCGENIEDKEKEGKLKREVKDTAKGEVRKQLQDRLKSDKSSKASQKSVAKSKGIKSWWAGQSTGFKALIVLGIAVVALGSIYLASGSDQGPIGQFTYQITQGSGDSNSGQGGSNGNSNTPSPNPSPSPNPNVCTKCNGTGTIKEPYTSQQKQNCTNCKGTGIIHEIDSYTCPECQGSGMRDETVTLYKYVTCPVCNGKGTL